MEAPPAAPAPAAQPQGWLWAPVKKEFVVAKRKREEAAPAIAPPPEAPKAEAGEAGAQPAAATAPTDKKPTAPPVRSATTVSADELSQAHKSKKQRKVSRLLHAGTDSLAEGAK